MRILTGAAIALTHSGPPMIEGVTLLDCEVPVCFTSPDGMAWHEHASFLRRAGMADEPSQARHTHALRACAGKCRCSEYSQLLGLDSSHLFLLARAAGRQTVDGPPKALYDLLSAHSCNGARRVVTTTTCLDGECFAMVGPTATSLTDVCEGITYGDVVEIIDVIQDDGHERLPGRVPVEDRQVTLDRGERSLVHALDGDDAVVVLNDEDAFDAIRGLVESGVVDVYPVISLRFVRAMYDCGALGSDEVKNLCAQVVTDLEERLYAMWPRKQRRKQRDVDELINHVALREAAHNQASGQVHGPSSSDEEAR